MFCSTTVFILCPPSNPISTQHGLLGSWPSFFYIPIRQMVLIVHITRLATSCNILVFAYSVLCIVAYVCNAVDFDIFLYLFDNFVILSSFFLFYHRMMTFNNKFKNRLCTKKKVIKILFLNLLRQNSKVYSLASRFDVQRNNVHLHGGLIKNKVWIF